MTALAVMPAKAATVQVQPALRLVAVERLALYLMPAIEAMLLGVVVAQAQVEIGRRKKTKKTGDGLAFQWPLLPE